MSRFVRSDEQSRWAACIPDSWGCDRLKWSVDLCATRPTESERGTLPHISNEDIAPWSGKLLTGGPKATEIDGRTFKKNDVLFNKLRPYLAKVYHAEFDGVSSGELLCLRATRAVESRFLFYVLVSKGFIDAVNAQSFGAKMPRADWGIVGHQPLPLPPLTTQRRIASLLDRETPRIDRMVERKRRLVDLLAERRQALISHAVTGGLDAHTSKKHSGLNGIDDIPTHWQVLQLRRIIQMRSGDFIGSEEVDIEGPYAVYGGNGARGFAKCYNTSGPIVLIGRQGAHCGNVHIAYDRIWVSEHALRCFPTMKLDDAWLAYNLQNMNLNQYAISAAQPGLSVDNLSQLKTTVPPLETQSQIARFLDATTSELDTVSNRIADSIDRLREYRSALITAAVTGQIDVATWGKAGQTDRRMLSNLEGRA